MIVVTEEGLASLIAAHLPAAVYQGIKSFKEQELQEKLLSPEETCNLFKPKLTKPTLETYAEKGYVTKYHLGGRTWYKYSEVIEALKTLRRYTRQPNLPQRA